MVRQAIFCAEGEELRTVIPAHTPSPGREPQIPFPILEDIIYGRKREAIRYVQAVP